MNTYHILPLWVFLVFAILLVSSITLIYTQGNWRTTLSFAGITTLIAGVIFGLDSFLSYLAVHFIGQYDSLGIPFRKAGPGWSLLLEAWPLWVMPSVLLMVLVLALEWLLRTFFPAEETPLPSQLSEIPTPSSSSSSETSSHIFQHIELETLKREISGLTQQLEMASLHAQEQTNKNQELQIELHQLQESQQEKNRELKDELAALKLEIDAQEIEKEKLTELVMKQKEEIILLRK